MTNYAPEGQVSLRPAGGVCQPRVHVDGLRICLAGTSMDVVDDIAFEIRSGEILGVVGETGSGKSTVALSLLGYARRGLRIDSGTILVDGVDVLKLSTRELQAARGSRISYVPQDPASALNPALRVGTQIEQVLRVHPGVIDDVQARMEEVLEEVLLTGSVDYLHRYPHQLSGGQQQRVALAMAFACRPSVIVLDEPTTGLDVSTQRHVLDTVRRLCSAYGVAALYVSHDLAVVSGLASSVAVMYAGRIVELGQTQNVFDSPVHPYTQRLLAAIPLPDRTETLRGIEGSPPRPGGRPGGCFFAPRCRERVEACAEPPPLVTAGGRLVRCWRAEEQLDVAVPRGGAIPARPSSESTILDVDGLSASYGMHDVLHTVSMSVPAESCTAIVGESGSGKTTLARCIVGMHSSFTGTLRFNGKDLPRRTSGRPQELLRRVQYIFQNPYTSLNPRKTIGQILAQPLDHFFDLPADTRDARIFRVLGDVSLSDSFVERRPDQLSGGERQRVAVARALVVEPELLVCDEVTSALDVSVQAMLVELLRRLQAERQLSMIFITHNLALVRSIAQSVVVLASGSVVEAGSVEDVLGHAQDPYTISLIENVPTLANRRPIPNEGRDHA